MTSSTATMSLAGAGAAEGPEAVSRAVRQALGGLDDGGAGIVLLFPSASFGHRAAAEQARAAAGETPVVGVTGNGVIGMGGPIDHGASAVAFDRSIQVGIGVSERASADRRLAGRLAAGEAFAQVDPEAGNALTLLFVDPLIGDQADALAGVYDVAGPGVPIVGGGAGGAAGNEDSAQFAAGKAHGDALIVVTLVSPRPIGIGIGHGCEPRAVPSIVTRAEGHVIHRLDGRPADVVYLEKLGRAGEELTDEEFMELSVMHPLAQPELSGEIRLRQVHGRAPGGGLVCATRISENAAVEFTEQTPERIVRSAWDVVSSALEPLEGAPARAALVFDCAGRKWAVGERLEREAQTLLSSFGTTPPLAGFYSHGEFGRVRGAKGDRNHTLVVVALG